MKGRSRCVDIKRVGQMPRPRTLTLIRLRVINDLEYMYNFILGVFVWTARTYPIIEKEHDLIYTSLITNVVLNGV